MTYESLAMPFKTFLATGMFLTGIIAICACIYIGKKQGKAKLALLILSSVIVFAAMLLHASMIRAERATQPIPEISLRFARIPVLIPVAFWLLSLVFLIFAIKAEIRRRKTEITPSSIKESFDHLETGLCFSKPDGLILLTNHRMIGLSHTLFGKPLENADLFWNALENQSPLPSVKRLSEGAQPEFLLPDGSVLSFRRENLNGIYQITAADITRRHQLNDELQKRNTELEAMHARIRSYGEKVNEYVIARERLETRANLHGFMGQALLMTRNHLINRTGSRNQMLDIWQRNIEILRMEADSVSETDSFKSLINAASAIGMQVSVTGEVPKNSAVNTLMASLGAEALTNAVRHAGAKQLFIDIEKSGTVLSARYTNDGALPASDIKEGGGLGSARRKAEAAGGRLTVETNPRFILTLSFDEEVTENV